METFIIFLVYLYNVFLWFVLFLVFLYFSYYVISTCVLFKRVRELDANDPMIDFLDNEFSPFTFVVPGHNEGEKLVATAEHLLALSFDNKEVVIINDGSTDDTLKHLIKKFSLQPIPPVVPQEVKTAKIRHYYRSKEHPSLLVIDKEHGGKADALNAGLNCSANKTFINLDADTMLDEKALKKALYIFHTGDNSIALSSNLGIANDAEMKKGLLKTTHFPKKLLPGIQAVEYIRSYFNYRAGASTVDGNIIIPGGFGVFDREKVRSVGHYPSGTINEDMDLTLNLHRHLMRQKKRYFIDFLPCHVAWTRVPKKWKSLFRQRERWQRGTFKVLWKHKTMFANPRYRGLGFVGMPFILMEHFAIYVELICYILIPVCWILGIINWVIVVLFLAISFTYSIMLGCMGLVNERFYFQCYPRNLRLFLRAVFAEHFGFHQWVLFARFRAHWSNRKMRHHS